MNSVIITGASSGIGQKIALLFSEKGFFVILSGRDENRLNQTQKQLQSPENSLMITGDLAIPSSCDKLIEQAKAVHQKHPLFSLINNAGIFHRQKFQETSDEVWTAQFNTNLMSAVRLSRGLISTLKSVNNSSIINVSSSLGIRTAADTSAYSSIKAGMISLTETLAIELAPDIRVNCVAPGMTHTPIHDFYGKETPELLEQLNQIQPMLRLGQPEEIAKAIFYLAGEDSSWITGTTMKIDGGISL